MKIKKLIQEFKFAISSNDHDFTSGSLRRAIFLLSVPMVLEMIMESIFAVVDIFYISQLGSDAVATVGITESLMTLVYAIGIGLGTGTTAIIARRVGEKNKEAASKAAVQAIVLGILLSFFISVPGILWAKDILRVMGSSEAMIESGYLYTKYMMGGNVVIMLLFIINAVFRSAGDAAISMRVLLVANALNLILDPILIFGWGWIPAMGIKGAAIATNIGRGIAVVYQFYLLFRGSKRIRLYWHDITISVNTMIQLLKLSIGGIGQSIIATSSWIGLVRIIAEFGSDVLAAYTIAIRIVIFTLLPSWGMSNAAATLVGQNLGANKPERAEKSVMTAGYFNMILLGMFAIIFVSFPEVFVRLFINDEDVVAHGVTALRIISFGYLAYAFGMVLIQSFNGAGDTFTPTIINFFAFWMFEIPLAYLLAIHWGFNEQGVYYAIIASETVLTIVSFYIFRKGKWKLKMV